MGNVIDRLVSGTGEVFLKTRFAMVLGVVMLNISTASVIFASVTPEQRQGESEINAVSSAVSSWLVDQVCFSKDEVLGSSLLGGGLCSSLTADMMDFPSISFAELESELVPTYIAAVPEFDPWGNAYDYRLSVCPFDSPGLVAIRSAGADGEFSSDSYLSGDVANEDDDLVSANFRGIRTLPLAPFEQQARAVDEVQEAASAILAWITDVASSVEKNVEVSPVAGVVDLGDYVSITTQDLADLLVPFYTQCLPDIDPWGNAYQYWLDTEDVLATELTGIRSLGEDGLASGDTYSIGPFPSIEQDPDLVWVDGFFVRFPADDGLFFFDGFETGDTCSWTSVVP